MLEAERLMMKGVIARPEAVPPLLAHHRRLAVRGTARGWWVWSSLIKLGVVRLLLVWSVPPLSLTGLPPRSSGRLCDPAHARS